MQSTNIRRHGAVVGAVILSSALLAAHSLRAEPAEKVSGPRLPAVQLDFLVETDHAAELGRRYANETAIIAWDLTDEPPFWIVGGQTSDAAAINWTRLITSGLRRHDRLHPIVVGTSGQETGHGPFRADDIARSRSPPAPGSRP